MKSEENLRKISLRIHSEVLSIEDIDQCLQISATESHRNGERMSPDNPLSAKYDGNLWILEFEQKSTLTELFLEASLFLDENKDAFLKLAEDCSMDLFVGYFANDSQNSFFLEHKTLARFVQVPVDFVFDIYS